MNKKEHPIGVGVVGLGRFGQFLLSAYREMEEIQVVGVCDVEKARALALAPATAQVYEKFADLLRNQEVKIVVIGTPPFLHGSMAIQAAQAGKHVLVEKPLAIDLAEAQTVVKVAYENGVLLTVDYVLRYHPLHRLAMQIVREKIFGEPHLFALINLATDEDLDPQHWFWDTAKSGGIFVEHGVHFFDLANQLASVPPSSVHGYALRNPEGRLDRVGAVVRYGEKMLATFYHSFNRPRCIERTTIHLGLASGEIRIEGWIPVRLSLHGLVAEEKLPILEGLLGKPVEKIGQHGGRIEIQAEVCAPDRQEEYKRAIQAVMRDLVRAIREKRKPTVTPEDALASLAVAIEATKVAEEASRDFPI